MDDEFEVRGYRTDKFGVSLYCEKCRIENSLIETRVPIDGKCIYCKSEGKVYQMKLMVSANWLMDVQIVGKPGTNLLTWEEKNIKREKF